MLKETIKNTADVWFRPKQFETPEFYEKRGIRTFNSLTPSELLTKVLKKKGIKINYRSYGALKTAEAWARVIETTHIAGMAPIFYTMAKDPDVIPIGMALNIFVNIYPIALQRYKRLRFVKIRDRLEKRYKPEENQNVNYSADI